MIQGFLRHVGDMARTPTPRTIQSAVVDFANSILDDDRLEFTFEEACEVAFAIGLSIATPVIRNLRALGFSMAPRAVPRRVRTISSCDNDRFFGPGCMNTCAGAGFFSVAGHMMGHAREMLY